MPLSPPLGWPRVSGELDDLLSAQHYLRDGQDLRRRGLYLDLPAHGTCLFHAQPGPGF